MHSIKITQGASAHIQKMIEQTENAKAFRLSIKKTGCSGYAYVPDVVGEGKEDDFAFETEDGLQVYVDTKAKELLEDIVIDYVLEEGQGLKQKRLVFINPKETGRCGCGESFTIE